MNDQQKLLSAFADIGKAMLVSGAEVYRIEDTMTRLLTAYGAEKGEVVAVPSFITITASFDGDEITTFRRVTTLNTDLELLDRLNALSRRICAEKPDTQEILKLTEKALNGPVYGHLMRCAAYFLACFAFTLLFTGGLMDAFVSGVIGICIYLLTRLINKIGGNKVFVNILCGAFASFAAIMLVRLGIGIDADKIIIGAVMVLVPGVELLNGIRDFISGDIQAGLMHISEALFLAVAISVGAASMHMLLSHYALV